MNTRTASALSRMAAQQFPTDPPEVGADVAPHFNTAPHVAAGGIAAHPTRLTRRRVLVAVGVVVATSATLVGIPSLTGSPAYAETPPLLRFSPLNSEENVMPTLADLAQAAANQPPPRGAGIFNYIHTKGWFLDVEQTTSGRVISSQVQPYDRRLWVDVTGAGRIQQTWNDEISTPSGTYRSGQLFTAPTMTGSAPELQEQLRRANPDRSPAQWVAAIKDTWANEVVTPALQSALLQILSQQPVLLEGATTDRLGRRGIAISVESSDGDSRTKEILVLDPTSGMLLGYEEVALVARDLPIAAPATVSYIMWLSTGYVADTRTEPI